MNKRAFLAAAAAVTVAVGVGAGVSQGSATKKSAPQAAPSGTVTLNGWQSSPAEEDLLAKVVQAFQRTHPNIKVNYSSFNNYQATMLAKFSARKPADVFYVDVADFADWVRQGVLEPLDKYASQVEVQEQAVLHEPAERVQVQGQDLRLPEGLVVARHGSEHEAAREQQDPDDVGTARAVAQKLNVPGGKPICLSADWARLMAFVYQAGGIGPVQGRERRLPSGRRPTSTSA